MSCLQLWLLLEGGLGWCYYPLCNVLSRQKDCKLFKSAMYDFLSQSGIVKTFEMCYQVRSDFKPAVIGNFCMQVFVCMCVCVTMLLFCCALFFLFIFKYFFLKQSMAEMQNKHSIKSFKAFTVSCCKVVGSISLLGYGLLQHQLAVLNEFHQLVVVISLLSRLYLDRCKAVSKEQEGSKGIKMGMPHLEMQESPQDYFSLILLEII